MREAGPAPADILGAMRTLGLGLLAALGLAAGPRSGVAQRESLAEGLTQRVAASGAEVGLFFRTLDGLDSLTLAPDLRFHAASTMKLPVMIQVFRDVDSGRVRLDDRVDVRRTFRSIVDGSAYDLDPADDSDSTLYARVGRTATVRELVELMITRSSNLAANLLINLVSAARVNRTAHQLGADSIAVLRGVQDIPAFNAGLNNTTTARDLGDLLWTVAGDEAASPEGCRQMIAVLERQRFRDGIPALLPRGTRVAHKTGDITGINHDAGIVYPRRGTPYVLVVLTRGIEDQKVSSRLIAEISELVYRHVTRRGRR